MPVKVPVEFLVRCQRYNPPLEPILHGEALEVMNTLNEQIDLCNKRIASIEAFSEAH